jgi:hypothetical protein
LAMMIVTITTNKNIGRKSLHEILSFYIVCRSLLSFCLDDIVGFPCMSFYST